MKTLLKGGQVFQSGLFRTADVLVHNGIVVSIQPDLPAEAGDLVFFLQGCHLLPGLADVHVHLREPGFSYKETIAGGSAAAARGGFTLLAAMPNLNPAPDSPAHLEEELALIRATARVPVLPYGCITKGRQGRDVCDFAAMAPLVAGFSDDGSGVQDEAVMRAAMRAARKADVLLCAHCEDENLLQGGVIHAGTWAKAQGLPGISSESEWKQIERDIALVAETGARYHVCHVSTKEGVALLRAAKARGLPVSCETASHYLCFCDEDLQDDGRFKMNPPLRSRADQQALIEGLADGTVDMIATDHAPHSAEEKAGGLAHSLMGVVGLETALAACYTRLVLGGHLSLETLVERMSGAPRRLLRREGAGIAPGRPLDAVAVDFAREWTVDPAAFAGAGRSTPFAGARLRGQVKMTWAEGKLVWGAPDDGPRQALQGKTAGGNMKKMTDTQRCEILLNAPIAKDTWRMEVACNTAGFAPGRFVNVAVPGFYLRRPLAICDYTEGRLTMVYREVGGGTQRLAAMAPGETLDILCPLGNGFTLQQGGRVLLAGGGVGLAPLLCLARQLKANGCEVQVAGGFNTAAEVYLREEFAAVADNFVVATVDGSLGTKGLITAALPGGAFDTFYACGPLAMLKALCENLPGEGEVSTEERMACGFGGCMGCSILTRSGMKRVCKDGPVFKKGELIW